MNDEHILLQTKNLTLSYLRKIGAQIDEIDGLYTVTIPTQYETIFGGLIKRITFEHRIADIHSCEFVVPGSNFFSIVLNEIKKQAPVVGGHLKKSHTPEEHLSKISTHNCNVTLNGSSEDIKKAVRLYFNINIKSIKSTSMLRWIDVDFETLTPLDFPAEIELDPTAGKIKYEQEDKKIEHCYNKAIEILQNEVQPLAFKYVELTKNSLKKDLDSLNQVYEKRRKEINSEVQYQKAKLEEFDRKIINARTYETQQKYVKEKQKQQERIKLAEQKAVTQIERLTADKQLQIEQINKRYLPTVDFSLIAAIVFSYSSYNCSIVLQNSHAKKEINCMFFDPSSSFVIRCEICDREAEQSHLCTNSHAVCDFCIRHCVRCQKDVCIGCVTELNPCYICKEGLCSRCISKCTFCEELTCSNHLSVCMHCSANTCFFCSDSCEYCSRRFCNKAINHCSDCKRRICVNDSKICSECRNVFCPNDRIICGICSSICCKTDLFKCSSCEQAYGRSCITKGVCDSCRNFKDIQKDSPLINEIMMHNSELSKYKKWEFVENHHYKIFKAKKTFGTRLLVYDKTQGKIIINKKGGWR